MKFGDCNIFKDIFKSSRSCWCSSSYNKYSSRQRRTIVLRVCRSLKGERLSRPPDPALAKKKKHCAFQIKFLQHNNNKKFWEELIAYYPLIRHGRHRNRRVQQFLYCCVCVRCSVNVSTEPMPSNKRGIQICTHRLMGGICEGRSWDGLRCHDIHINFHKDWFTLTKVDGKGLDSQTHRQQGELISLILFFQNKESRLKMT
jgi:hypothetical protein